MESTQASPYPIKALELSAALLTVGNVGVLDSCDSFIVPAQEFLAQRKSESHSSRLGETDERLDRLPCRGATNSCEAIRF